MNICDVLYICDINICDIMYICDINICDILIIELSCIELLQLSELKFCN